MVKFKRCREIGFDWTNDIFLSSNILIDGKLNIYGLLVNKEDLLNNKKGTILKKCPYVRDKNILKLILKLKGPNFLNVRQALSDYLRIKRIRKDTFYNWLKKRKYPLSLVRVVCSLMDKNILDVIKDAKITDFCNKSQIKFPTKHHEITSPFMAYFVGLHFGDGTLNKGRWKIVDGDKQSANLKYSLDFLLNLKKRLEAIFSLKLLRVYKIRNKNAYELIVSNKWFCRYLNLVYGLEYNRKTNPMIPPMLEDKRDLVLRGLFDTDGSVKDYRISFGTKYFKLYKYVCSVLNENSIEYRKKLNNIKRENVVYIVEIKKNHINTFIRKIGFSHHRKITEVEKYLRSSSSSRKFIGYHELYKPQIPKEKFIELCTYIRPIRDAGRIRFLSKFNKLDLRKKDELINNFKLNFGTDREPNSKGIVNSFLIERILTNYCDYLSDREPTKGYLIKKITTNLMAIWT